MGVRPEQLAAMAAQARQPPQPSCRPQRSAATALASSQGGQGRRPRRVQLAKGALYVGAVDARGRPHGEGELLLRDGSVHAGHFVEGAAHGEGAPALSPARTALPPHVHRVYTASCAHGICSRRLRTPATHAHQASTLTATARCTAVAG